MASATLSLFCTPQELARYLRDAASEFDCRVLVFAGEEPAVPVEPGALESLPAAARRIFLHPADPVRRWKDLGDVSPREWGWVDVRPGVLAEAQGGPCLTLTEIAGESSDAVAVPPSKIVSWLKRRVKPEVVFGVRGVNPVTGGSARYRDIGFTEGARAMLASGASWRQAPMHRSLFEPDAA